MSRSHDSRGFIEFALPGGPVRLVMPSKTESGPCGVVLLVAGSPSADREVECLTALSRVLRDRGIATLLLHRIHTTPQQLIDDVSEAIVQCSLRQEIRSEQIGLLGIGLGAAMVAAVLQNRVVSRVCLVSPVSPELLHRKSESEQSLQIGPEIVADLAARQPLRGFVNHLGPALILIASADSSIPIGHGFAYSSAREYSDRAVDRYQFAFADATFSDQPSRENLHAVVSEFYSAMQSG